VKQAELGRNAVTLGPALIRRLVGEALDEDRAAVDATTSALIPPNQQGHATIMAKAHGVIAGLPLSEEAFRAVDPTLRWRAEISDGATVAPGAQIATIEGSLNAILRAERVALNYLAHLSGIATATNRIVRLLEGTECRLRDTRKTTPGLRILEKYATRVGGATNHRRDLADGVLIKDNHLAALRSREVGSEEAVRLARAANPGLRIEIEVEDLADAQAAAAAGADELLLDNMTPAQIREVITALGTPHPILEASGGITQANARAYAETGVDYISMGAITHSAQALDVSLEIESR
jgi:nicotinate-nucleotide pyrophosphorylase (carboxylating)